MLSPLNPLKANPEELISDSHRLEMLRIATKGNPRLLPCDIELSMPQPSYSINSLNRLQELHPDKQFSLIIGSDNWLMFDRWRSYEEIIKNFSPIVYPRPGYNIGIHTLPQNVTLVNAPTLDISSTFIRDSIAMGFDMQNFLPKGVAEYINQNGLYR
jgi:nicotinate-nucleotide adenylyltransferase